MAIEAPTEYHPGREPSLGLDEMYRALLLPRLIEEKMLLQLRKGTISKWFAGIGQEAIAVGATLALEQDEYILPMFRNLGVFTSRKIPLKKLIAQWLGRASGFTNGRDRTFHFGTQEYHIIGMISHLGAQLCVANGIALAHKRRNANKVTIAFTGEGGTSQGDFHEALNVAAVWDLPVIFIVENNQYALSTPTKEQFRCSGLVERAAGYGIEGVQLDGNDFLGVYREINRIASKVRRDPAPVLVECMTFRMRGHEEASGTKYVPKHLFEEWSRKDPIARFESYLRKENLFTLEEIEELRAEVGDEIDLAIEQAIAEPAVVVSVERELADVFSPSPAASGLPEGGKRTAVRFVDAIADALRLALERDDSLIVMGQDVAEYGGVFKVTEGLLEKFGKERIRNTPLCESAIVGAALGYSINKGNSVLEMQFADFVSCGFNQVINNLGKTHYRWGDPVKTVLRLPCGGGMQAGPFHSQTMEAWFMHNPGLKVVYPSNPADAKGLLLAAIEDPNPVMFFEHKWLYRRSQGDVPDGYYTLPFGEAKVVQEGSDVSIITYGLGVYWALDAAKRFPDTSFQILDLRTLVPLDTDAIAASVEKTGRVIVLHEAVLNAGPGAEIAAFISEHCFSALDAPVQRCASLDTPVPFVAELEQSYLASSRLDASIQRLLAY